MIIVIIIIKGQSIGYKSAVLKNVVRETAV